ncbi:hypothetical protein FXW78_02730 [Rhodococcus opacus]|nr:hypothetical protein [Rhodococcus opacus]
MTTVTSLIRGTVLVRAGELIAKLGRDPARRRWGQVARPARRREVTHRLIVNQVSVLLHR